MRHSITIFLAIAIIKRGIEWRIAAATIIRWKIITLAIEGITPRKE